MEDEKLENHPTEMTTLELVKYHFEGLGFSNENPKDLELVAQLHERWLKKDKTELTREQYILSQDPDVQEVLRKCRLTDNSKRRMTKTDLKIILEQIARGEITRTDYVGKDAIPVSVTPDFPERLNSIKILMGEVDTDNDEKIFFVDDIPEKYKQLYLEDNAP